MGSTRITLTCEQLETDPKSVCELFHLVVLASYPLTDGTVTAWVEAVTGVLALFTDPDGEVV